MKWYTLGLFYPKKNITTKIVQQHYKYGRYRQFAYCLVQQIRLRVKRPYPANKINNAHSTANVENCLVDIMSSSDVSGIEVSFT